LVLHVAIAVPNIQIGQIPENSGIIGLPVGCLGVVYCK
jgi:hypothetical protein